ncbi:thioredoxin peroxidase DOT5 [Sporobolomyces salmoneus]|uniref:thioredoxin peroxidase DOT5 n=1 Tax=Sporobolomyces salmoneus TaxID=183962 RepID=UPI00317F2883
MPSTRSESAPRRSSRASDLEKAKQQAEKKMKSTASKAARAVKPKAEEAKKVVKKTAAKVEKKVASKPSTNNNNNNKKSTSKSASTKSTPAPAKPAPAPRGPPKERGAPPTAEEKKELKAAKKESAQTAKTDKKSNGSGYQEGDAVEDITLKNDSDQDVALSSLYNESGLVIFTYPKANTPGCTTQSCNYRDITSEFESLGYKILGLSRDSPKSQASWKTKHDFEYDLLCDPDAELLKKLGATETQKRCHFIIEKGGKLLEAKIGVKPADDAKNALEFIKSLSDKKE